MAVLPLFRRIVIQVRLSSCRPRQLPHPAADLPHKATRAHQELHREIHQEPIRPLVKQAQVHPRRLQSIRQIQEAWALRLQASLLVPPRPSTAPTLLVSVVHLGHLSSHSLQMAQGTELQRQHHAQTPLRAVRPLRRARPCLQVARLRVSICSDLTLGLSLLERLVGLF
jgi:hypothetical protein